MAGRVYMSDSEKLQLATGFAYEQSYLNMIDKDGITHNTVNDVVNGGFDKTGCKNYKNYGDTRAGDWEVIECRDHDGPGESGFYGSLVKATDSDGNEQMILVFRGSNDNDIFNNPTDTIEEWWNNNAALLNSTEPTKQQEEAAAFAVEMMRKYDCNFSMIGHSLGGQLAFYVAIYIAENCPDLRDKITEACNLDGPGFSDEFIELHKDAINWLNNKDLLEHWQWSVVGDLLFDPVPKGSNKRKILKLENDKIKDFDRHTAKVKIDKYGNVVETDETDSMARIWGPTSRFVDKIGLSKEQVLVGLICIGFLGIDILDVLCLELLGPIGTLMVVVGVCAWAWDKLGGWDGIKDKLKKGWDGLVNVGKGIFNAIGDYIKKKREKKLDGDYEINYTKISEIAETFADVSRKMNEKANSGGQIILSCWNEIFKTTSSYHLEYLAKHCFDNTRDCASALKKASDSLYEICRIYTNGDQEAAGKYYSYGVAPSTKI